MIDIKHYRAAMDCQAACNLSGVIFSFADAMHAICDEQQKLGESTEWKNHHPICRLFAEQIRHLSGEPTGGLEYMRAYTAVAEVLQKEKT